MERRLLLLPQAALAAPLLQVLAVPCPRHGTRQVLLADGGVAELTRVQRPLGSWFVEDTVEGGGGVMHIASTMDPLFIMLPLLEQNAERFRPWTDIVGESDAAYGKVAAHLPNLLGALTSICDTKDIPGLDVSVIRLNQDRAFRWLLCKVESILKAVKAGAAGRSSMGTIAVARSLAVEHSSASSMSTAEEAKLGTQQLLTAVEVLCEYLSPLWQKRLYQHYQLPETRRETTSLMAIFSEQNRVTPNGARFVEKSADGGSAAEAATKKEGPALTAAQKRLRKVDTKGMPSLSSFFPKKQKSAAAAAVNEDDD